MNVPVQPQHTQVAKFTEGLEQRLELWAKIRAMARARAKARAVGKG